jgi:hypoxanthine phosphoribosyltransferase
LRKPEDVPLVSRYAPEQIAARVGEIAALLDGEPHKPDLILVGILKGASFLLSDLARALTRPAACEYINVKRMEGADEILQIDFETGFAVRDRPVLLVKDVVNTGVIETYLTQQFQADGASGVRLAAIVDKPSERRTAIACDFPLFTAESGVFAGYGMEYRGRYGQLAWVGEVPSSARETSGSAR